MVLEVSVVTLMADQLEEFNIFKMVLSRTLRGLFGNAKSAAGKSIYVHSARGTQSSHRTSQAYPHFERGRSHGDGTLASPGSNCATLATSRTFPSLQSRHPSPTSRSSTSPHARAGSAKPPSQPCGPRARAPESISGRWYARVNRAPLGRGKETSARGAYELAPRALGLWGVAVPI